jgi:hypothetical protein
MRTHRRWLDAAIYFVSVFLACIIVWYLLPSDYRGGGGAVAVMVSVLAMIFRFLLSLMVGRMSREERNEDRVATNESGRRGDFSP